MKELLDKILIEAKSVHKMQSNLAKLEKKLAARQRFLADDLKFFNRINKKRKAFQRDAEALDRLYDTDEKAWSKANRKFVQKWGVAMSWSDFLEMEAELKNDQADIERMADEIAAVKKQIEGAQDVKQTPKQVHRDIFGSKKEVVARAGKAISTNDRFLAKLQGYGWRRDKRTQGASPTGAHVATETVWVHPDGYKIVTYLHIGETKHDNFFRAVWKSK